MGGWWTFNARNNDNGPLVVYGNVDIGQVDLSFLVEGRIDRLLVQEGDRVQTGDILATLDLDGGPQAARA